MVLMADPLASWMWVEQAFVGVLVVVVFVLLVREWLSPDLVAMGAFVWSCWPGFSPKRMRRWYSGRGRR